MCAAHEIYIEVPLFEQTSPALKNSWSLEHSVYICLHNNSNDFARTSADGLINVTSVLRYSSLVALEGIERIAASPSTTHLTSLG